LAEWLGATFEGDGEREIAGVAALESATESDVSFVASRTGSSIHHLGGSAARAARAEANAAQAILRIRVTLA